MHKLVMWTKNIHFVYAHIIQEFSSVNPMIFWAHTLQKQADLPE